MRTDYTQTPAVTFYYQDDHEGSITHLTNASGNVIERYKYDAFGAPTILSALNTQLSTSAYGNRFLFTGREFVSQFGIYEYRNRAYHPGLGRFMSEDPKGFDAGDYNLFRYVGNDPLDKTDPMGLEADLNMFNPKGGEREQILYAGAKNMPSEQGVFIVAGHGTPSVMKDVTRVVGPQAVAKKITATEAFKEVKTIRLVSCNCGDESNSKRAVFAQQLANATGKPVEAATAKVTIFSDGKWQVHQGGTMKTFYPQSQKSNGTHSPAKSPTTSPRTSLNDSERSTTSSAEASVSTSDDRATAATVEADGGGFARDLGLGGRNPRYFAPALP